MNTKLFLDLETYSEHGGPGAIGTYQYAAKCEPLLFAYAFDDEAPAVIDFTDPEWMQSPEAGSTGLPQRVMRALSDPSVTLIAHNSMFDRNVMRAQAHRKDHAPWDTPVDRWECTMVRALLHGFPGKLDTLSQIFQLPVEVAKLKTGKALINRFCSPAPSNHKAHRYDRLTHPQEWETFKKYAGNDITAMQALYDLLPRFNWNDAEKALYHLDQRINDRGFCVDMELVRAGARAAEVEKERLAARCLEITKGEVARPSLRSQLLTFLNREYNLELDNTRSATFQELLKRPEDIPAEARELMQISMLANKTSTAKYAAMLPAVSDDGRFRGGLQFSGASRTRRWAGRTFQPHNLPSRGLPAPEDVLRYIEALKADAHDFLFDDLMLYGAAALRGTVIAPQGSKLVVSDLSNIEGRLNAWVADEKWKIQAFKEYDAGTGPDPYNVTAGMILDKDPFDIDKTERQIFGKVPDLALGYEGGVGAWQTFAGIYGIRMIELLPQLRKSLPEDVFDRAEDNYDAWGKKTADGLPRMEWVASEAVKLAWRDRHPAIVSMWRSCKDAMHSALNKPGSVWKVRGGVFEFTARNYKGFDYLLAKLPSKRFLVYFQPNVTKDGGITYKGMDKTRNGGEYLQWQDSMLYGGKFIENACQTLGRDVLADHMPAVEKAGYRIVLTVHDENVTLTEDRETYTPEKLSALMVSDLPWTEGLPLSAAGFECDRYYKEG